MWRFNYEGNIGREEYWKRIISIIPLGLVAPVFALGFFFRISNVSNDFIPWFFFSPIFPILCIITTASFINIFGRTLSQRIKTVGDSGIKIFFLALIFLVIISVFSMFILNKGLENILFVRIIGLAVFSLMFLFVASIPIYYGITTRSREV